MAVKLSSHFYALTSITFLLINCYFLTSNYAYSASIAVIDSGIDIRHEKISTQVWIDSLDNETNGQTGVDEDNDGFIDDIHGWNFVDNNNQLIDSKYLTQFNSEHEKFFEIQIKFLDNSYIQDDIVWLKEKYKDPKFMSEIASMGNFIHGTHVAGICAEKSTTNKIQTLKIIPTEAKLKNKNLKSNASSGDEIYQDYLEGINQGLKELPLVKYVLHGIAKRQMEGMVEIVSYVNFHKIDIANGSFGTGFKDAKRICESIGRAVLERDTTDNELAEIATYFLTHVLSYGQNTFEKAPNTLFVFAAGNDNSNNDILPSSPTNVKADNTIAVAATFAQKDLANFSNYGAKMVDVAAPGVGIMSSVPNNKYLGLSGTSQAAPYVSNIAAQIKNTNPKLGPKDIKEILIKTVDVKNFLRGKVASSGIVNKDRAIKAAQISKNTSLSLANAIAQAQLEIKDAKSTISDSQYKRALLYQNLQYIMPLQNGFNF
ncbi:MAG: S8 family serine peptidase [Oligoflexia bacterium]|nr:S8 family serine peptidase [Oligoflexia bacterium]